MKTEIDWVNIILAELPLSPARIKSKPMFLMLLSRRYNSADDLIAALRSFRRWLKRYKKRFSKSWTV
jgi:hypothetical protein